MKLHKDTQLNGKEDQHYFLLVLVFNISTDFGEALMQKPFPPTKKKTKKSTDFGKVNVRFYIKIAVVNL